MSGASKTVYWTINKGVQQLTLSSNTISVSAGESATITASWLGDGVLTATSSDQSIATVSVSGNTITINGIRIGGVGITASVSEGTRYSAGSASVTANVNNLVTVAIPSQSGALTYNGNQQSPEWNNFDYSKMRQVAGSTFTAANAGTYTMVFTLLSGYKWSDGTTENKRIPWVINKASPNITAMPPQVIVQVGGQESVNISRSGDGAISVASSNNGIATVALNGTTATVTGVTRGEASIIVSCAATANYNAGTATIGVTSSISNTFSVTIDNRQPEDLIIIYSDGEYSPNYNTTTVPASSIGTFVVPKYATIILIWNYIGTSYYLRNNTGTAQMINPGIRIMYGQYQGKTAVPYLIEKGGAFYWIH